MFPHSPSQSPAGDLHDLVRHIGLDPDFSDRTRAFLAEKPDPVPPGLLLIRHNIDHPLIHDWWILRISDVQASQTGGPARLSSLLRLREDVAATAIDPRWARDTLRFALKERVLSEIDGAFRLAVIGYLLVPLPEIQQIIINLPVSEIALLLRLLNEHQVFRAPNTRSILRFATCCFRSKRQGVFSFRSLSKEYYSPSQVAAANLRGLLLQLVGAIDRKFFPAI